MKKLLVIAYEFPPIRASNDRMFHFCRFLPYFGWKPVIVAPRTPSAWLPAFDAGFSIPVEMEVHDAPAMRHFEYFARNLFLRVYLNSIFFLSSSYKVGQRILQQQGEDIRLVYATVPTFACLIAAYRLSRKFHKPLVLDFRDPHYPSWFYKREFLDALQYARQIITTTEVYKNELIQQGASSARIMVIPNGTDLSSVARLQKEEGLPRFSVFTVIYAGGYFNIYRVDTLVRILAVRFKDRNIRFVIVGEPESGQEGVIAFAKAQGLNVEFKGRLSQQDTLKELLKATVAYNGSSHPGGLGGKMYDYLACGLPVLGYNPKGSATCAFIEKYNVGLTTDQEEELVKNLEFLHGDPLLISKFQENGLSVVKSFDRERLTQALAETLNKIL